ncbi:MAG: CvpA family protein [Alkaliphilus sp.]
MIWIDVLLGIVFIISTVSGYLKGFIKTLFSLGSYVVAYIITRRYYESLAEWVRVNTRLNERIEGFVSYKYSDEIEMQVNETALEGSYGSQIWGIIENNILGSSMELQEYAKKSIESAKHEIIESVVTFLLEIICILVLFLVVRFLIMIATNLINKIFELPILGGINKIAGGALGALRGIIFVAAIVIVLFLIAIYFPEGAVAIGLEKSRLVTMLIEDVFLNLFRLNI